MVGIAAAIAARFPNARPPFDWGVFFNGTSDEIYRWDVAAMGRPVPSEAELAEWAALPPPPAPDWIEFTVAVNSNPDVRAVLNAAFAADKGLALMLGVGLGQAAQGDERTFLRAWQLANSAGLVQPGLIAQVQALATTFNLPAAFVSGLQTPGLPPIQPGGVQSFGGLGTQVIVTNPLPPQ